MAMSAIMTMPPSAACINITAAVCQSGWLCLTLGRLATQWPASPRVLRTRPPGRGSVHRTRATSRLCSCCGGNSPSLQKRDRDEEIVAALSEMPRQHRVRRIRTVESVCALFLGLNVRFDRRNAPVQVDNEDAQLQPAIHALSEKNLGLGTSVPQDGAGGEN
jgi:hypothetical protein